MPGEQARIALLLCLVGFLKEFRPSKPFGVAYMTGPVLNISTTQVDEVVLPMRTYSYMSLLVVSLLLTDFLRYKPVLVVGALAGVSTYSLLTFGRKFELVILAQCTHGIFMASEVAYSTYMYTRLDKAHYQKITSLTRTALLLGRALSGFLAQALISTTGARPYHLFYITLACEVGAAACACLLPRAARSLYFNRRSSGAATKAGPPPGRTSGPCSEGLRLLWADFQAAFTSSYVLKWSMWWAFTMCGFFQLTTYCKVLWKVMTQETNETYTSLYNGVAEALGTTAGAVVSLSCGWLGGGWYQRADLLLGVCSLLHGFLLYVSSITSSLTSSYICYVAFVVSYHLVITIATSEVARNITDDSYGLVFGVNTFLALVIQSVIAMAVQSPAGLALPVRAQFAVYAGYHTVLGLVYTIIAFFTALFMKDYKYTVTC
ncbi:thiamine transporter 1-like [Bacillus rossius redtenbacheri]|uniref:thiamine transporter 1-like n=1 Tax=Bacillus rossius redtenbacheri TaxID=93214 RepID=UPI002FDE5955